MHILHFHQELFLSVASAVVAISAFLPPSAFHYLLVYFYTSCILLTKSALLFKTHISFLLFLLVIWRKESLMLSLILKDHNFDVKTTGAISLQFIELDSKPVSPHYPVSTNVNHSKSNHCSPRHLIAGTTSVQMRTQLPRVAKWVVDACRRDITPMWNACVWEYGWGTVLKDLKELHMNQGFNIPLPSALWTSFLKGLFIPSHGFRQKGNVRSSTVYIDYEAQCIMKLWDS